jgi:hypothetical protein
MFYPILLEKYQHLFDHQLKIVDLNDLHHFVSVQLYFDEKEDLYILFHQNIDKIFI